MWKRQLFMLVLLLALIFGPIECLRYESSKPVMDADHAALLSFCQGMISEFRKERSDSNENPQGTVKEVDRHDLPSALTAIGAKYAKVTHDHVIICIAAFPRLYVLAFAEDAPKQYGGTKLIDRLWISSSPRRDLERANHPPEP